MDSLLPHTFLFLLLFFFVSSAKPLHRHRQSQQIHKPILQASSPEIRQACQATQYPDVCETTLSQSGLPQKPQPTDFIKFAINVSVQNLVTAEAMVKTLTATSSSDVNHTVAYSNCLQLLDYSHRRLAMAGESGGRIKDIRAWMSASLLYQYDCFNALKYVNDSQRVNETMAFLNSLMMLTSNALSMVISYDLFGSQIAMWGPPKTERNGFWESGGVPATGSGLQGGFPTGFSPDITVCKNGSGCYKTIQSAVDAAPSNSNGRKFVIHIKEGIYEETVRVPFEKKNVVFWGDGMGKTVITGKQAVKPGVSTYNTATVAVAGDGFMARDLTIENSAGPDAHQAVAFLSDSDLSIFYSCEFLGHQDTLYAHSLRQFYKSCRISGTVDFIFGNSASFFQDSVILLRERQIFPSKGESNTIAAHGRTDPAQSTGFVFQNCLINATEDYMQFYNQNPKVHKCYLGRPWKQYSRTVFIHCYMEKIITPQGWLPWDGNFALSTLYYGEFENSGPGSDTSARVTWSNQIPAKYISTYSIQNFIQGDQWIPSKF